MNNMNNFLMNGLNTTSKEVQGEKAQVAVNEQGEAPKQDIETATADAPMEKPRMSAKEGGLQPGIEKMREDMKSLTSMIDQIELLQKVPHGYKNIAGEGVVDSRNLPALDQFIEYRGSYETMQKQTEASLSNAYQAVMKQLTLLRDMTGIHSKEEAMKFDPATGRQPKDKI